MFSKSRFNNIFDAIMCERKIRNRTIVQELVLIKIRFLSRGDIVDWLRVGWNLSELRDRLTLLVIVGTRTEAHFLRSQVGIGSELDSLLGKLRRNFEISDWVAGLKVEKLGGMVDGAGEWGDVVIILCRHSSTLVKCFDHTAVYGSHCSISETRESHSTKHRKMAYFDTQP